MNNLYKKGELSEKDFCTDVVNCGDLSHKCSKTCDHESCLVLFYASWCPHCVHFVDTWNKLQKLENSKVFFASYNAANKPQFWAGKNNALVQGYPTIIKYKKRGSGKFTADETFAGNRGSIDELFNFAMKGLISPARSNRLTPKPRSIRATPKSSRSIKKKSVK